MKCIERTLKQISRVVEVDARIEGLAKLTKGYGGADLRALCTEYEFLHL